MGMDKWLDMYPPQDKDRSGAESNGRSPVGRKRLRKLPPESRLDLHGYTAEEARDAVESFLRESKLSGCRKVLIIHGKGYHSPGEPVLKKEVYRLLENSPITGEFGTADRNDGGSGAVWVLLK